MKCILVNNIRTKGQHDEAPMSVMYTGHGVLLNVSVESRCNLIDNGNTVLRFSLLSKEGLKYDIAINKWEGNWNASISKTSKLEPLESLDA